MAGVTVTAKCDGFRRCGRAWSVQPATVAEDEFDAEQWERLRAEPMLVVEDGVFDRRSDGDAEPKPKTSRRRSRGRKST